MTSLTGLPARPIFLEFDPTAANQDNARELEYHNAQIGQPAIVKPDYGSFYRHTLSMFWQGPNRVLLPMVDGTDYVCAEFDAETTKKTGFEVYKAILVTNITLPGVYALSYHAVGGHDNVDTALAYQQFVVSQSGSDAVAFSSIQQTPDTYPPVPHTHDLKDVYGVEFVRNAVAKLKTIIQSKFSAYGKTATPPKDAEITYALGQYKNSIAADLTNLVLAIQQHINNTGYAHHYTKAMVGLGAVVNGDFVPVNLNGTQLPVYAHPKAVHDALVTLPGQTGAGAAHKAIVNGNPHADTANNIGLGNLKNVGMYTTYTFAQQQYQTILSQTAAEKYIAPFVIVNAVGEAQSAQVQQNLTNPLISVTDPATGLIAKAVAANTAAQTAIAAAQDAVANAQDALTTTFDAIEVANAANAKFLILNYNSHYAALLSQLVQLEWSAFGTNSSVSPDGYYPVPGLLDNLYLWLDVNSSRNTYQTDGGGQVRLMALQDRSPNNRLFSAHSLATAPKFTDSADVTLGVPGLSVGKVALFEAGTYLDQIAGPPVSLNPGMTVIALVRTASQNTVFTLLTDIANVPLASIKVQPHPGVAIQLDNTFAWTPLISAANSVQENTSSLIVASVSETDESLNWAASVMPIDPSFPRGTNTPLSDWPAPFYQSTPMTRMGTPDTGSLAGGELVELLIYNRQLSFAEVQAIIDYLRLAKSHNLAFTVDLSAQNEF